MHMNMTLIYMGTKVELVRAAHTDTSMWYVRTPSGATILVPTHEMLFVQDGPDHTLYHMVEEEANKDALYYHGKGYTTEKHTCPLGGWMVIIRNYNTEVAA